MALAYLWYLSGDKIQKYIGGLSEKVYLQMSSDPILCKAEKGFAAESSPKNSRSFPVWRISFSYRHHHIIIIMIVITIIINIVQIIIVTIIIMKQDLCSWCHEKIVCHSLLPSPVDYTRHTLTVATILMKSRGAEMMMMNGT